jgi:hypothetical protein
MERKAVKDEQLRRTAETEFSYSPKIQPKSEKLKREGSSVQRLYDPEWVARRREPQNK